MRILITALTILVATTASAQLSRSFTESFGSPVDSADYFLVSIVKDVIPEVGVKFMPSKEEFYSFETEGITILPADSATYTYTEPGVYVIVPLKGNNPLCFGSYVVMNEDYLDFYLNEPEHLTVVDDESITSLYTHIVGDPDIPILSQALWNQ